MDADVSIMTVTPKKSVTTSPETHIGFGLNQSEFAHALESRNPNNLN